MSDVGLRCPRCTSSQVDHVWRTDMAEPALIDQWKCRDIGCGHHWDTRVTYAQLQDPGSRAPGPTARRDLRDPPPGPSGPAL